MSGVSGQHNNTKVPFLDGTFLLFSSQEGRTPSSRSVPPYVRSRPSHHPHLPSPFCGCETRTYPFFGPL